MQRPNIEKPDISEKGAPKDGQPQTSDRRLFMQLLAFGDCADTAALTNALKSAGVSGALYEDVNDPFGVGLLTFSEDPAFFVGELRNLLQREPFASLSSRPQYTMSGRTYSLGYEPDLEDSLFGRPTRTVLNPDWCWSIWYPLRRCGAFSQLPHDKQREILGEHGVIGRSFGEADLVHDVRLACHGLDANDNDFVIGLVGKELYPLSAIVQAMRKTQQTSMYLERLGPFLVGKVAWQSVLPG